MLRKLPKTLGPVAALIGTALLAGICETQAASIAQSSAMPETPLGQDAAPNSALAPDADSALDSPVPSHDPFEHPPALERDIRFWIRVYTEVTTDQGLLHDDWNLGLVYEVLRFDPALSPSQREHRVNEAKARYAALLRRLAAGDTAALTPHERRIQHAFGENATAEQFRDAIEHIRFQLGQANRFHEGLIRALAWEPHIAKVLSQHGVPVEIACLPHVESSFNLAAYSKVGAAGLWQFMPATARRFMRVDGLVDERLDPYTATEAAANLMLYNYRLVGTWPLTVTAYNHGPGGLRHAQDELGTSDIDVIVKRYQGASFGFASRNFYVAFLAALEVDRNAEKFFGPITRLPNTESTPVELPDYVPIDSLAKAFKVDMGALRVLNPALRPPIWSGSRWVPRGYRLRIPGTVAPAEIAASWARLPSSQRYLAQRNDGVHRMRKGETLAGVALASGVSLPRLLSVNGWSGSHVVGRGQNVRIPLPPSRADATGAPPPEPIVASTADMAAPSTPPAPPAPPAPPDKSAPPPREPVTERQTQSAALLPAMSPTANADATDYAVGQGDTVVVQAGETLGYLADWSGSDAQTLRRLNGLKKNGVVAVGRRVKLDLSTVTAAQFTASRRAYHKKLQDDFFAEHRIAGTDTYVVKRGDSLWTIQRQHGDLPSWLIAQYNPDLSVADIKPGSTLSLPRVDPINRR